MRISINLATRPFADLGPALRRLRIAMGSLAVLCLGLWLGLHLLHGRADKVRAQERTLDSSIGQLNQEQQQYKALEAQPQNATVINQAAALNSLIDRKAFSWTLAMEDLETVLPGGVAVTTLEPNVDKKDAHVSVRLRVVGPRDKAVELVANLEHSRRFLQPRIIGESQESSNSNNPNQQFEPVSASNRENFDILADYNPATPAEREAAKKADAQQTAASAESAPEQPAPAPVSAPRPVRPHQVIKPNPDSQRHPYVPPPHSARPTVQDTPPTPPQAFTGGPQ